MAKGSRIAPCVRSGAVISARPRIMRSSGLVIMPPASFPTARRSVPRTRERGRVTAVGSRGWARVGAYWCTARLQPHREALALHCLGLAGYETYYPRLRDRRIRHGRKIELRPALFPGYCFVLIQLQWHTARWAPGTLGLIMDGIQPAKVPDPVI